MVRLTVSLALGSVMVIAAGWSGVPIAGASGDPRPAATHDRATQVATPPVFEPNQGQFHPDVRFASRGRGATTFLTESGAVLALPAATLRVTFDAKPRSPIGVERQLGVVNYLIGNVSSAWRTGIPTFARVRYDDLYPGIGLDYGSRDGTQAFRFIVAPGADPAAITMRIDGARPLVRAEDGTLTLTTASDTLTLRAPEVHQVIRGTRRVVASRYVVDGTAVRVALGDYDRRAALVIEPQLVYGTFLGGTGDRLDQLFAVDVDEEGAAYVVGMTETTDYPTLDPIQHLRGSSNAVITKLTADGRREYATYIGGSGFDSAADVAVRADGTAYILGDTTSRDFPVVDAYQANYAGQNDVFLVELSRDGRAITRGTYLGGGDSDQAGGLVLARAVDVGALGDQAPHNVFGDWLFVYGSTRSPNFPTERAAQDRRLGERDGFFAAFERATLRPGVSTYVGREGDNRADGMAISPATGDIYLYLQRTDDVGPVLARLTPRSRAQASDIDQVELGDLAAGAGQSVVKELSALKADTDAAIAQLKSAAARGLCSPASAEKQIKFIADKFEEAVGRYKAVCYGLTAGGSRATAGDSPALSGALLSLIVPGCLPVAPATTCTERAAVIYLSKDLEVLAVKNFGGTRVGRQFAPRTMVMDMAARLHLVGSTSDRTLPLVSPIMSEPTEAFAMTMDAATGETSFLSYLGGSGADTVSDVAVDVHGNTWIVGTTQSRDFPVTRSGVQTELNGRIDGFVIKVQP